MSAWSDWQCGAITYDEYAFACRMEEIREKIAEENDEDEMEDES